MRNFLFSFNIFFSVYKLEFQYTYPSSLKLISFSTAFSLGMGTTIFVLCFFCVLYMTDFKSGRRSPSEEMPTRIQGVLILTNTWIGLWVLGLASHVSQRSKSRQFLKCKEYTYVIQFNNKTINWECALVTCPTYRRFLMYLQQSSFENSVAKGEIAHSESFLL